MRFLKHFEKDGIALRLWNSVWVGVPIWLVSFYWVAYWRFHLPVPGKAIGALAVVAGVMSVRDIKVLGKMAWVALLICMVIIEYRSIDRDRKDAQAAEDQHLKEERESFKGILKQQDDHFRAILQDDDKNFQQTVDKLVTSHGEDEKAFAGVLTKQDQAFEAQHELSEQLVGRLVPGNGPTPANSCLPAGQDPHDGQILVIFGDNGAIVMGLPNTVLMIGDSQVISIDRVENSNAIALSLDFRDPENRIAFRMDKNGVVDRIGSLLFLHPNKNTFLIQDNFGKEFLRATYVNPKVFEVQDKAIYCGRIFDIQSPLIHKGCASGSSAAWKFGGFQCPMPKP
jgi:hypothetical protein